MASYGHDKRKFDIGDTVRVKTKEECGALRLRGDFDEKHAGTVQEILDFDWTGEGGFIPR